MAAKHEHTNVPSGSIDGYLHRSLHFGVSDVIYGLFVLQQYSPGA